MTLDDIRAPVHRTGFFQLGRGEQPALLLTTSEFSQFAEEQIAPTIPGGGFARYSGLV